MYCDNEYRFKVSFDLMCEYTHNSVTYAVRVGCHEINTREDYIHQGVIPLIGTVTVNTDGAGQRFPPTEVVEYFSKEYGIPLVGAKWAPGFTGIMYDGPAPTPAVRIWEGHTWMLPEWSAECDRRSKVWRKAAEVA
jgi:hypothetical protein